MKIDNEFTVSVPIDKAWEVLTDLEGIAPCLPGAQLTGREGDDYLGKVKIKVGPVTTEYAGTATFSSKDDTAYRAVIDAKGRDSRGAGNAAAVITAQLRADGEQTIVTVDTDLKISGKIAQLGSGMIQEVSKKLLGQFVDCLEAKLAAGPASATPDEALPVAGPPAKVGPTQQAPEPETLDLLGLAGGAVARRLIPVAVGIVVVVAVIIYVASR
jgi:carbon monoxide dehydrogenase subunit G